MLLAFDYDGTLAPIVTDPAKAVMRPRTRALLDTLTERYPCVVISGRSQADAKRLLRGIGLAEVIGNHGIEPWSISRRMARETDSWRPVLEKHFAAFPGVHVENKDYSLAVHYRRSRAKKKARAEIRRVATALGRVRLIGGKQVVNILPPDAPHKGMALERERERLRCDTAIYVGDDTTDEDVFALDQPGQLLTIRVGAKSSSAAVYYLRNQRDIDRLLQKLLDLRSAPLRTSLQ
ncbi:MAG: trehalose-phosphatase [Deltaproteobacteria bacterium]|nr:trehalose-phosphatase [Deltaproteobacteria bacterium]